MMSLAFGSLFPALFDNNFFFFFFQNKNKLSYSLDVSHPKKEKKKKKRDKFLNYWATKTAFAWGEIQWGKFENQRRERVNSVSCTREQLLLLAIVKVWNLFVFTRDRAGQWVKKRGWRTRTETAPAQPPPLPSSGRANQSWL
jgi:hypothetical protein